MCQCEYRRVSDVMLGVRGVPPSSISELLLLFTLHSIHNRVLVNGGQIENICAELLNNSDLISAFFPIFRDIFLKIPKKNLRIQRSKAELIGKKA